MPSTPKLLYQRRTTGNRAVDDEFRRLEDVLRLLGPLASNLEVVTADLATGANSVPHRLGRVPIGRIVLFQSAAATLNDVSSDAVNWVLNASAPTTVKLIFV